MALARTGRANKPAAYPNKEYCQMGWQSDWLYQLIFDEVRRAWRKAIREGRGKFGPAPTSGLVKELPDADWEAARCFGQVQRMWLYCGGNLEALSLEEEPDTGL